MVEKIYMAVTADKYELPLFVSTSVYEVADKFGVSVNAVRSSISHNATGKKTGRKFVRVEIEVE